MKTVDVLTRLAAYRLPSSPSTFARLQRLGHLPRGKFTAGGQQDTFDPAEVDAAILALINVRRANDIARNVVQPLRVLPPPDSPALRAFLNGANGGSR